MNVSAAAIFLGLSTHALRRLDRGGELVPSRDAKGNRDYTEAQLVEFARRTLSIDRLPTYGDIAQTRRQIVDMLCGIMKRTEVAQPRHAIMAAAVCDNILERMSKAQSNVVDMEKLSDDQLLLMAGDQAAQ